MTENEKKLIEGLINQDEKVTRGFFYAQCKPMLSSVAREVFMEELNYDAIIDAFYHYLLADNGAVLRQFAGKDNKSTIYRWLRNTAKSFFQKKKKEALIDLRSKHPLYVENVGEPTNKKYKNNKEMDVAAMLDMIELERDRLVLERIDVEGASYDEVAAETGLTKPNLYNIRKRAIDRLKKKAQTALKGADATCAIRCEQYTLDIFGIHKSMSELRYLSEEKGWIAEDNSMPICHFGNISREYGLAVRTFKSTLSAVDAAIKAGKQILVAVDGGELIGNPFDEKLEDMIVGKIADHCVVVLDYDKENGNVMLFNPAFGDIPLTVKVNTFLDAWEDSGNHTIEIGKKFIN